MKISTWAILAAVTIATAGCGSSDSSSSKSAPAETAAPTETASPAKVIAHGVDGPNDGYDLVVGQAHHVLEASRNMGDARMIIHAREGKVETFDKSPAGVIEEMYAKDSYRHYGNDGEPSTPSCTVADQDEVEVDGYDAAAVLNAGQPREPVSCTLADGTVMYVSAWRK